MKRRANGKGNAIYMGYNRENPWVARITLGQDEEGRQIRHYLGRFKTELEALIYLEEYHKKPTPIYIKQAKFDKIFLPANFDYPLIPVENPKLEKYRMLQKDKYTFARVYEEFAKQKLLTDEEIIQVKTTNTNIKGKYSLSKSIAFRAYYKHTKKLHNRLYKDLTTKDFQNIINSINSVSKGGGITSSLIRMFRSMDKYALQEGVIDKGYTQFVNNDTANIEKKTKSVFTYDEIFKLENLETTKKRENLIKDILLIALYTGFRVSEILFLKNENIFIDKGYMVGGSKTLAGINREVPIHHKIKHIIEKYYDKNNEYLLNNKGKAFNYRDNFIKSYARMKKKYDFLSSHTVHECRHTFRTELERMNVKQVIINAIIGHSNGNVGLDKYTHITLEEKKMAVNMINYGKKNNIVVLKTS